MNDSCKRKTNVKEKVKISIYQIFLFDNFNFNNNELYFYDGLKKIKKRSIFFFVHQIKK